MSDASYTSVQKANISSSAPSTPFLAVQSNPKALSTLQNVQNWTAGVFKAFSSLKNVFQRISAGESQTSQSFFQ